MATGLLLAALAACTTVLVRSPVPAEWLEGAAPYGIERPFLRAWGDALGEEGVEAIVASRAAALGAANATAIAEGLPIPGAALALSGGGADGAFGAGLLAGWTERGDRPQFQIVSGVSTGAIIGFFAFLGPDYDPALRDFYTTHRTADLLTPAILTGVLRGAAITDTTRFRRLIDHYVDEAAVRAVAEAHRAGRVLLIGTTNLDATRPVVWNIGEIAASGHPEAPRLIRDVIQASSAIPGVFPPVLIPVTARGRRYDEMHVDGGATRQVMLFSPEVPVRRIDASLGAKVDRRLYVVINNRLERAYAPVAPRLRPIALTAISSLIVGSGTGDLFQLYAVAARDRAPIGIVSIPSSFDLTPSEPFDPVYMRTLYEVGFTMGRDGVPWSSRPPNFPAAEDLSTLPQ